VSNYCNAGLDLTGFFHITHMQIDRWSGLWKTRQLTECTESSTMSRSEQLSEQITV